MSNIISETSSVDLTDGSRHSKKSVGKKPTTTSPSPMTSPNVVQKVVAAEEEVELDRAR